VTWASLPVADMYEATVARGSYLRTRAYPFRRASFVFCERLFFDCQRAPRANTRANDTRVQLVGNWRSSRARARARASQV